jgi:hypothetical protein
MHALAEKVAVPCAESLMSRCYKETAGSEIPQPPSLTIIDVLKSFESKGDVLLVLGSYSVRCPMSRV